MSTKIELPDLAKSLPAILKRQGSSMRKVSLSMGHPHNYLATNLQSKNPRIALLIELSARTGLNMLEPYMNMLEPAIRPTSQERLLLQKITDLAAELETVKAERDKYWEVVAKK